MLALVYSAQRLKEGEAYALEFGVPLDPKMTPEELILWVLEDYDERRDFIWDVEMPAAITILCEIVPRMAADKQRLIASMLALGWIGKPRGNDVVEPLLDHPDDDVRLAAIRAVGQMGVFATIPKIRSYLDHPDRRFRKEAIIALGKYAKTDATEGLDRAAGADPELTRLASEAKRRAAATEGVFAHRVSLPRLVEVVLETDEYEDLAGLVGFVWEALRDIAADPARDLKLRIRAVRLLGLGRIGKVRNIVRKMLVDAEPRELKLTAVMALGRMKAISAIGPLLEILDGADLEMKKASIVSLGQIGFPTALEGLLKHWDDQGGTLQADLRLTARRVCPIGAVGLADLIRANGSVPLAEVRFIDDELRLRSGFRAERVSPLLEHPDARVRHDALLLYAVFGQASDAPRLTQLESAEADPVNRDLAAHVRRRVNSLGGMRQ